MKRSEMITLSRRSFLGGMSAAAIQLACAGSPLKAEASGEDRIAETKYGKIRGRMLGKAVGFLGVPYGGPTEGAGRFLPPSQPSPFIFDVNNTRLENNPAQTELQMLKPYPCGLV